MVYSLMVRQAARHCGSGIRQLWQPQGMMLPGVCRSVVRFSGAGSAATPSGATALESRTSACGGRGCAGSRSPAMPSYLGTLSKEHGAVSDSFRCMHSFDVRHRCPDELSTPIHVVRTSKSITGVVQRLSLIHI